MNGNTKMNEKSLPIVEDGREFWREVGKEFIKSSIETLDNIAKQVIAVSGILTGLYYNGVTVADIKLYTQNNIATTLFYTFPVIFFSISVTCALLVFFPDKYKINLLSSESAKSTYEAILKSKLLLVRVSATGLIIGTLGLIFVLFSYLYYS